LQDGRVADVQTLNGTRVVLRRHVWLAATATAHRGVGVLPWPSLVATGNHVEVAQVIPNLGADPQDCLMYGKAVR
jgi:hypothetical protein